MIITPLEPSSASLPSTTTPFTLTCKLLSPMLSSVYDTCICFLILLKYTFTTVEPSPAICVLSIRSFLEYSKPSFGLTMVPSTMPIISSVITVPVVPSLSTVSPSSYSLFKVTFS